MSRSSRTESCARPRLELAAADSPRRALAKPLGVSDAGDLIGLAVPDARHHVHVLGITGTGKSTWLAHQVLAEAYAGRGVVLLDCQGDLARHVLARLPGHTGRRLVVIDPAETHAPPAWNILSSASDGLAGREYAAEHVVGTFRKLYAAWWGPRMDEVFRAACLTIVRRPGATLPDVVTVLTRPRFRHRVLAERGGPEGLDGFWEGFDALTEAQRAQLCGPVLSRLRAVLSRRFVRDLLGTPTSTFNLKDVLDGGILIARLAKGEIGEDTARLVGSLLLSGLWQATIGRSAQPPDQRRDATIVADECHNFLHLPIGMDDVLAEARGYRLCLVLAHQHLTQLAPDIRDAIDANARNKIVFTVSPTDARTLERHVSPFFDADDLAGRPSFHITARIMHRGQHAAPFTLRTAPLPEPIPGRADQLRDAAGARAGLTMQQRTQASNQRQLAATHGLEKIQGRAASGGQGSGESPSRSGSRSLPRSPSHSERDSERETPHVPSTQHSRGLQP